MNSRVDAEAVDLLRCPESLGTFQSTSARQLGWSLIWPISELKYKRVTDEAEDRLIRVFGTSAASPYVRWHYKRELRVTTLIFEGRENPGGRLQFRTAPELAIFQRKPVLCLRRCFLSCLYSNLEGPGLVRRPRHTCRIQGIL